MYEYGKEDLLYYSILVIKELEKRNIKIKSWENYHKYLWGTFCDEIKEPFKRHHTEKYLIQCFFNLQEKYDRGQKDFNEEEYKKLQDFIKGELKI